MTAKTEHIDEALMTWASPRQREFIHAVNTAGSIRSAAKALNCDHAGIVRSIQSLKRHAAVRGYSPEHDMTRTAPSPFVVKGVSTYYNKDGVPSGQWVKTRLNNELAEEAIREAVSALIDDARGTYQPITAPDRTQAALCNLFTITDAHVGMLAWGKETGADWDLKIAENTLMGAFASLVESTPKADTAVILQLGDFLHIDTMKPLTPEHQNLLDADGRFSKIVAVGVRILRNVIDLALTRHEHVHVVMAEGNHDMASSVWMRHLFTLLYEKEPRLKVNASERPYYALRHGKVFLGFHHGHLRKNDSLPGLFAALHREMWGATTKCYIHTGHRHHVDEREYPGAKVIQHPTIAAPDAYAARGGWLSEREMTAITYHAEHGQVARHTVTPEMLQ